MKEALALVRPEILRSRIESVTAVDVSRKVSQIKVPILYLRATHDSLVPPSAAQYIRKLSRNLDVQDVDGPHLLLQAQPVQGAEIIMQFSRRVVGLEDESAATGNPR